MRRKPAKFKMALRGRSGFLVYMVIGTFMFVALYYAWNSVFPTTKKVTYSSHYLGRGELPKSWQNQVQQFQQRRPPQQPFGQAQHQQPPPPHQEQQQQPLQPQQPMVVQEPPSALNRELEMQQAMENWKKQQIQEDLKDEALLEQEEVSKEEKTEKKTQPASQQPSGFPYQPADPADGNFFQKMERLIHLDLKGAPPLVSYLEKLFPLFRSLGATGLLMEYEDMFPYSDNLAILAAENAYSSSDLQRIQTAAKLSGLEIVPLVQTFGHMEFVLKHKLFRSLRENDYTPQVISPVNNASYSLISNMIQQILKAHPDSRRIHLGCDEVYGLGQGQSKSVLEAEQIDPSQMFLRHVVRVASSVKNSFPQVQPLIWDDWIRWIPEETIERSAMNKLVEPVVWQYSPNILQRIPPEVWEKYGRVFPGVWVASAFKGATGSSQHITNATFHLENNLRWVSLMRDFGRVKKMVQFRGVVLTGWQRFDHFAVLCELMPVGLPSLAVCLQAVQDGGFEQRAHQQASKLLNCTNDLGLDLPAYSLKTKLNVTRDCHFPGSDVYYDVQELYGIVARYTKDRGLQERITGWLSDFNVRHGFSSPGQMKVLADKITKLLGDLKSLEGPTREHLTKLYDSKSVEEWLETHIKDRAAEMKHVLDKAETQLTKKTWGSRFAVGEGEGGQQQQVQGQVVVYPVPKNSLTAGQVPVANQGVANQGYQALPQGPRVANVPGNAGAVGQVVMANNYGNPAGRINSNLNQLGSINTNLNQLGSNNLKPMIGVNNMNNLLQAGSISSKLNAPGNMNQVNQLGGVNSFNPLGNINRQNPPGGRLNAAEAIAGGGNVGQLQFGAGASNLGQQGGRLSQTLLRRPDFPHMPSGPGKLSAGQTQAQDGPRWNPVQNVLPGQQRPSVTTVKQQFVNPELQGSQFLKNLRERPAAQQDVNKPDEQQVKVPMLKPSVDQNKGYLPEGPEKRPVPVESGHNRHTSIPGGGAVDSKPAPTSSAQRGEDNKVGQQGAGEVMSPRPGGDKPDGRSAVDHVTQRLSVSTSRKPAVDPGLEREGNPAAQVGDDQEGQEVLDSFTGRGKHVLQEDNQHKQVDHDDLNDQHKQVDHDVFNDQHKQVDHDDLNDQHKQVDSQQSVGQADGVDTGKKRPQDKVYADYEDEDDDAF